jgi:hypothetical protein
MAEDGIPEILAEQRLGHEVPGMRGLYAHASERMRDELKHALQARWEESLIARAAIETHSPVPLLDEFLAPFRDPGHQKSEPAAPRETNKQPTTRGDMEKMISQIPPKHTESLSHGSRLRLKERASDQVKDRIQRVDLITSYSKRRDLADALVSAVQQLRQAQARGGRAAPSMRSDLSLRPWRVEHRLSRVDVEQILVAFAAGTPKRELAERYGISESSVKRLIRQQGASKSPSGVMKPTRARRRPARRRCPLAWRCSLVTSSRSAGSPTATTPTS